LCSFILFSSFVFFKFSFYLLLFDICKCSLLFNVYCVSLFMVVCCCSTLLLPLVIVVISHRCCYLRVFVIVIGDHSSLLPFVTCHCMLLFDACHCFLLDAKTLIFPIIHYLLLAITFLFIVLSLLILSPSCPHARVYLIQT